MPTDAAGGARGTVSLRAADSPFTTSVTADGVQLWELELDVRDLPDPHALGPYTSYVAWATTPALQPEIRLGPVTNGRATLGPVALDALLILVSAEPSANAATRAGPLVLRGSSAATRLQPADFGRVLAELTPARRRAGLLPPAAASHDAENAHGGHAREPGVPSGPAPATWPTVPMHPQVEMPRALMELGPDVSPFLPSTEAGPPPAAHPAAIVDLADGDTLSLVAAPVLRRIGGQTFVMYAFNGSHPGPLVRVERGTAITVQFENRTDWPTAVHWHGVRLDNASDGVPGVTQEPVLPGGRFTYRLRFPDAGVFWYHPHHRSDVQQDLGLYGNLHVGRPQPAPAVHREELLIVDDLLVGDAGLVPWGREAATHALMGRVGNVTLVNGEPRWELAIDRDAVVRFHLTNASNARVWNLSFGDAPMKVVGADLGPFEQERRVTSVVLAPAERYAVDVRFPRTGAYPLLNRVRGIDPFRGRFFDEVDTLGVVRVGERRAAPDLSDAFEALRTDSAALAEIEEFRRAAPATADRELVLTLEETDLPFPIEPLLSLESVYAPPVEWVGAMPEMNAASTALDLRWVLREASTGAENEAIHWRFQVGDRVRIRLRSDRSAVHPMHHPIHVHGQRFLILTQDGRGRRDLAWKDTLLLPAGGTAEILLDVSNPGRWMLHCHTAEHLEAGMRMVFEVEPRADAADGAPLREPEIARDR